MTDTRSRLLRVGLALSFHRMADLSDDDLRHYIEVESALPPLPGFADAHEAILTRAHDELRRREQPA